jgi:hypothetical protein
MRKILFLLSALAFVAGACKQTTKQPTDIPISLNTIDTPHLERTTSNCKHTELSAKFDIELDIEHYLYSIADEYLSDSVIVKLQINNKLTQKLLDSIVFNPNSSGCFFYTASEYGCNDVTSYSTGFNADREIFDNYFGTVVVADLNFDGKDDIAMVLDSGASSGPRYIFFIQNDEGKFIEDKFLTEEMSYFPDEIDRPHRKLTTYVHLNAVSYSKSVYQLDLDAKAWKQISYEVLQ